MKIFLANTISKKIRGKTRPVSDGLEDEHIDGVYEDFQRTYAESALENKRAEKEEQLDTRELVELLQKDAEIMRPEEAQQLSGPFSL